MPGLVLEGGTFRPIFSAGVMDALLDENIMFHIVSGYQQGLPTGFPMRRVRKNAICRFCSGTAMINGIWEQGIC